MVQGRRIQQAQGYGPEFLAGSTCGNKCGNASQNSPVFTAKYESPQLHHKYVLDTGVVLLGL